MTTQDYHATAGQPPAPAPSTLAGQLAAFFRSRPGEWIDGRRLAAVGGSYAWRTRVSELRRAPYFMDIANRQRRVETPHRTVTISEYVYVSGTGFAEEGGIR